MLWLKMAAGLIRICAGAYQASDHVIRASHVIHPCCMIAHLISAYLSWSSSCLPLTPLLTVLTGRVVAASRLVRASWQLPVGELGWDTIGVRIGERHVGILMR